MSFAQGSEEVGQCNDVVLDLGGVQIGGVRHGSGVIAIVPVLDDGVKEVGEHLRAAADTRVAGRAFKRGSQTTGWSRLAGEVISTLFARNQKTVIVFYLRRRFS